MRPRDAGGPTDLLFGRQLREERLLAGLGGDALARELAIDAATLRRYEAGEARLPAELLARAVTALRLPLSFLCYALETDCAGADDEDAERRRWRALSRPPTALSRPEFARVQPLFDLWKSTRGVLDDAIFVTLAESGILDRTFLLRQLPARERLVLEHCATRISFLAPCESLAMTGRGFDELPDAPYGAWVAEAYAETAWREALRVQSVRALIRSSAGRMLCARYDRVLMPWRRRGEVFVSCVSLQRTLSAAD